MAPKWAPKGWVSCPALSEGIICDKFFAFKTPITKSENSENRFTVEDVVTHISSLNQKFVCWIDLTNTNRYYDSSEVSSQGIEYHKLAFKGIGNIPSNSDVEKFLEICKKFKNSEGVIGIHCTHGFNRTGYLICKYMISELGYSAKDSISQFAENRPPGIYRSNYITDLYPGNISLPKTPSWDT